jgi:hypothetical protein
MTTDDGCERAIEYTKPRKDLTKTPLASGGNGLEDIQ